MAYSGLCGTLSAAATANVEVPYLLKHATFTEYGSRKGMTARDGYSKFLVSRASDSERGRRLDKVGTRISAS